MHWGAVGQIIMIDILLGGDNAVIIALASRKLPLHQNQYGVSLGVLGHAKKASPETRTKTGLMLRVEGEVLVMADDQGKELRVPTKDIEKNRETALSQLTLEEVA